MSHIQAPAISMPADDQKSAEPIQPVSHAQQRYFASATCQEARQRLQALVDSPDYNTDPASAVIDPVSFVERHLRHLSAYPATNLEGYMSNLKIMTSARLS